MPYLENYPVDVQETENSCWASAGRSIVNWYSLPDITYGSDQAFADAWNEAVPGHGYNDINVQRSAAAALADLGYDNNTDERAIPTPSEIFEEIDAGRPLLAIVGDTLPNPSPNLAYQNGHWVVIVGIDSPQEPARLTVFDPATGMLNEVDYSAQLYQPGAYWQNTSYVDPHA